jgi:hypothetical protein
MTSELVFVPQPPDSREGKWFALTPAQAILRKLVLDAVQSPHTRRNYAKALDDLFQFCASRPLSRALLMEWKAGMESLSPSTTNVRLSAVQPSNPETHPERKFTSLLESLKFVHHRTVL